MITKKTIYVASDNKEFENRVEAQNWEDVLAFSEQAKEWERKTGCSAQGYLEFLMIVLETHYITPK